MSKDENVIQFPNPSERLLEKAGKLIEKEKYKEAFDILETIEVSEENIIEVEFMRIICLTEFGIYEEAITKCQQILETVYVEEVLFIYINLLKIVGRNEEAEQVIKEFEHADEFSDEEIEHFEQVFAEMSENVEISVEEFKEVFADQSKMQEQAMILKILENRDIAPFLPQMKNILKAKKPSLMVKTAIFELLEQHQVKNKVTITKLGKQMSIQPNDIPEELYEWGESIEKQISHFVEHSNPSLYNLTLETWDSLAYLLYPMILDDFEPKVWAAAIINYTSIINGEKIVGERKVGQFIQKNNEQIFEVLDFISQAFEASGMEWLPE